VVRRRSARGLAGQLLTAAACAIDALRAPLSPYSSKIAQLAQDPDMERVQHRLGALLAGSKPDHTRVQAPVSFRVIPQVLTHLERTIGRLEEDVRRTLRASDDSPAFVDGEFVTSGNFHAIGLAAGMDALAMALVQAAELAAQHIHRLLDHRFSGLPDQLAGRPGPHAGLIVVHKRAVGTLNEVRRLAMPASVGLMDTSLGQEDAMTFAYEAAEKAAAGRNPGPGGRGLRAADGVPGLVAGFVRPRHGSGKTCRPAQRCHRTDQGGSPAGRRHRKRRGTPGTRRLR